MPTVPKKFIEQEVTLDGVTKTVGEWCAERGLKPENVHSRKRHSSWAESLSPVSKSTSRMPRMRVGRGW